MKPFIAFGRPSDATYAKSIDGIQSKKLSRFFLEIPILYLRFFKIFVSYNNVKAVHQNLEIPQCTTCCLRFLKAIIWSWPSQLTSQNITTFFRPWHHLVAGMIFGKTSAPSLDAAGIRRQVFVKIPSGQIFHKKEFSLQSNM